jgi:thiamine kinase-like enzyme
MNTEKLRAQVPFFADAKTLTVNPFTDGMSRNNANYKVIADGEEYFVRVGASTGHLFGIRRAEEQVALRAAGAIDVAPPLLYADDTGTLVMPFLGNAHHWTPEEAARPENITRLADTLRRLHAIPAAQVAVKSTIYTRISWMLVGLVERGAQPEWEWESLLVWVYLTCLERKQDMRFPAGLCHGDFWLHNFLDDGTQLWLIDWEFTCVGDSMIDLAKIVIGGSCYTPEQQKMLLHAYGYTEPGDYEILQQMKNVLLAFQAVWALVQHGVRGSDTRVEGGFDYLTHSNNTFAHLKNTLQLPDMRSARLARLKEEYPFLDQV